MPYRYRCAQCRTASDPVATRTAAESEGAWHRARVHAGHHPDGESVTPETEDGAGVGGLFLAIVIGCVIIAALARLIH